MQLPARVRGQRGCGGRGVAESAEERRGDSGLGLAGTVQGQLWVGGWVGGGKETEDS